MTNGHWGNSKWIINSSHTYSGNFNRINSRGIIKTTSNTKIIIGKVTGRKGQFRIKVMTIEPVHIDKKQVSTTINKPRITRITTKWVICNYRDGCVSPTISNYICPSVVDNRTIYTILKKCVPYLINKIIII